jgi:chromosome segregation ATPase
MSDLETRLAVLEADRADYRAVIASVNALGERVDALTSRVDGLTGRVDGLGQRVERLDAAVDKLQARVEGLDGGFDRVDARMADIAAATSGQRDDTSGLGEKLDARLRAVDEGQAELKELMLQAVGGGKAKKVKPESKG